jgi:uncharacterized protein (DUF433 family)
MDSILNDPLVKCIEPGFGPRFHDTKVQLQHIIQLIRDESPDHEIIKWYPMLTARHLELIREYYFAHREEADAMDKHFKQETESERAEQEKKLGPIIRANRQRLNAMLIERKKQKEAVAHAG